MDNFKRIKLGCELSAQLTSLWISEGADLLDFEVIMCHALSAQIIGAARDSKKDPIELANIIHKFTLKFIEKQNNYAEEKYCTDSVAGRET